MKRREKSDMDSQSDNVSIEKTQFVCQEEPPQNMVWVGWGGSRNIDILHFESPLSILTQSMRKSF
jgi:hypothetical protein